MLLIGSYIVPRSHLQPPAVPHAKMSYVAGPAVLHNYVSTATKMTACQKIRQSDFPKNFPYN